MYTLINIRLCRWNNNLLHIKITKTTNQYTEYCTDAPSLTTVLQLCSFIAINFQYRKQDVPGKLFTFKWFQRLAIANARADLYPSISWKAKLAEQHGQTEGLFILNECNWQWKFSCNYRYSSFVLTNFYILLR